MWYIGSMFKPKTKLTPVRYPGGKSNALKFLDVHLPKDFNEYREPFFGGGSVGLYLMQFNKTASYWINDKFYPVYCFWKTVYEHPEEMVHWLLSKRFVHTYQSKTPEIIVKGTPSVSAEKTGRLLHEWCRKEIENTIKAGDEFTTGCLWYILNKTSYSGMAMIGTYAPLAWDQNFTENCIKNLPKTSELLHSVHELSITNVDYSFLLSNKGQDNTFIFLDPPYDIKDNLYGNKGDMHRGFDHQLFANQVKECKHKWMITYNDNETIRKWFSEYQCVPWDLQYTMKAAKREGQVGSVSTGKSGKKGKELLVTNWS